MNLIQVNLISSFQFEFKAKGMKKRKVSIEISVEGVKVALLRRKPKVNNNNKAKSNGPCAHDDDVIPETLTQKKDWPVDDATVPLLMHHPVYR